ncbi:MAG: hypothetical protein ACRC4T_15535 [Cetobacterium sp.]
MLTEKERLFISRYSEFKEGKIKLGQLYFEVFNEKGNAREGRAKAEALLRRESVKAEMLRIENESKANNLEVDLDDDTSVQDFVRARLLQLHQQASVIKTLTDRNGNITGEKFLDPSTMLKTLELLGKSSGLFTKKQEEEPEATTWEIK